MKNELHSERGEINEAGWGGVGWGCDRSAAAGL